MATYFEKATQGNTLGKEWKNEIANAITTKGVQTSATANKKTFVDNILNIPSSGGITSGTRIPLNTINSPTETEKIRITTNDSLYYNLGMEDWGNKHLIHGRTSYNAYCLTVVNADLTQQHIENVITYCMNGENLIVGLSDNKVKLLNSSLTATWERQIPTVNTNAIRRITIHNNLIYVLTGADAKEQQYIFILNMTGEIVKQKYFGDQFTENGIYASEIKATDTHVIVICKKNVLVFNLELELLSKKDYTGSYGINFGYKQQRLFDMLGSFILFTNNNIIVIDKVNPTQDFKIFGGVYYGYYFKQMTEDTIITMTDSKTKTKIYKFTKNESGSISYSSLKEFAFATYAMTKVSDGYLCKTNNELYKLDNNYNYAWTIPVKLTTNSEYSNFSSDGYDVGTGNEAVFIKDEYYYTHANGHLLKIDKIPCLTIK